MSSAIVPVRSDKDSAPVGDTVSIPSRRWVLPLRPSKFATGVIVFVWRLATDADRFKVAERVAEKVGVWNVSLRSMRWCTTWYLWRKRSVLCDGFGNKEGFTVDLSKSARRTVAFES